MLEKLGKLLIFYVSAISGQLIIAILVANFTPIDTEIPWVTGIFVTPIFVTILLMLMSLARLVYPRFEFIGYFLYFVIFMWGIATLIFIVLAFFVM